MRAPTAITEPKPHRGDPPFCPPHADPAHAELPPSAHPPLPTPLCPPPSPPFQVACHSSQPASRGHADPQRALCELRELCGDSHVLQRPGKSHNSPPKSHSSPPKSHNSPPSLTTLPPTHTHVTHSTTYARISGTLPCSLSSQFDAGMHGAMRRGLPQRRLRPVQRALGLPGRL